MLACVRAHRGADCGGTGRAAGHPPELLELYSGKPVAVRGSEIGLRALAQVYRPIS